MKIEADACATTQMPVGNPTSMFLGQLSNTVPYPQLSEWLRSPTRDIHARLAYFEEATSSDPSASAGSSTSAYSSPQKTPRSSLLSSDCGGSSMAPACIHQPSTASQHPPSLYNFSEATPTETSISTGLASHFSGVPLLEDRNGVLEQRTLDPELRRRLPIYECTFWFLCCGYISHDASEWKTHCLSHFRGEEPPRSVSCPLCSDFNFTSPDGWTSWEQRMQHLGYHHAVLGEGIRRSRPDFALFQHLWCKRLIDDTDLKELKGGNHDLRRVPGNFVETNGNARRRDVGRGVRRQHVGVRR